MPLLPQPQHSRSRMMIQQKLPPHILLLHIENNLPVGYLRLICRSSHVIPGGKKCAGDYRPLQSFFWGNFHLCPGRCPVEKLHPFEGRKFKEALNKLARAGSVRFFVRQKNGKQWNTVCISCFSFCVDGEKDKLSSRRRFIQSFPKK